MFKIKAVQKIKTHILCSITSPPHPHQNRAVYEIMWKNIVEPNRPQMGIWRMRIARWIAKATNTHSEYVILLFFHCNNGCTNSAGYYVICTLPVLFYFVKNAQ